MAFLEFIQFISRASMRNSLRGSSIEILYGLEPVLCALRVSYGRKMDCAFLPGLLRLVKVRRK
jgi:hypothetical protein